MNPINNNNLFLHLPFEVKNKICYHLFFDFNRESVIALLKTCSDFLQLKGPILQQWPHYFRERTIQNIRSRSLPKHLEIVEDYEQEAFLDFHSGTVFLSKWFNQFNLLHDRDQLMDEMQALTNNNFKTSISSFQGNEIELAFAYTSISNNKEVIKLLIDKYGYQSAFDTLLKFTKGDDLLQGTLLKSFIEYGSKKEKFDLDSISLSPFIKVLLNTNIKLPFKSVPALISYLIIPLLNAKKGNIVNELFQLIPENYSFCNDIIEDNSTSMIISIYIKNITPISPSSFERKMTLEEEDKFINAIEELPHKVLKAKVIDSILDVFYLKEPEMLEVWSCLQRIEKHFCIQQQAPNGCNFFDRSTETLINQLIQKNYQNFIDLLGSPEKFSFEFLTAVAHLFSNRPDFLLKTMALDDDINDLLHQHIIKLLIGYKKFEEARTLFEKINDSSIKEVLKNNLD